MEKLKEKIEATVNLYKSGNLIECETATKKLMESNPKITFLYNLLGLVLSAQNREDEALNVYNEGIKIDSNYAMIYNNLALIYYDRSKKNIDFESNIKKAEELFKECIKLNPKIPEANTNLGNLYNYINKNEESIKFHKMAISANPKYFYTYINIAHVYISDGNFIEAKKYLIEGIKQNPNFTQAHRELSRITKYKKGDEHIKQLQNIYNKENSPKDINKMNIAFALGKAFEDIGNYEESFSYYQIANSINRTMVNFSIKEERTFFDEIKETYNKNIFSKYKNYQTESHSPIFIVGMPRSGTTLVEQILASHPKVFGAEEVYYIPQLIEKYFSLKKINLFFQGIFDFEPSNLKKFGEEYISLMKKISKNSERTTDKFPPNFLYLGLIKIIFPNSKIIHCHRDPRDNIFSIYKNHFPGKIPFSCDLNDIVEYYNLYFDLMNFWDNLLPNFIFNIKYEKLINNTEENIQKLLKFCNLNWSDECLHFYNTKRSIRTASDTQVRNKIYNSSINSWKKYEKFLNKYYKKLNVQNI